MFTFIHLPLISINNAVIHPSKHEFPWNINLTSLRLLLGSLSLLKPSFNLFIVLCVTQSHQQSHRTTFRKSNSHCQPRAARPGSSGPHRCSGPGPCSLPAPPGLGTTLSESKNEEGGVVGMNKGAKDGGESGEKTWKRKEK